MIFFFFYQCPLHTTVEAAAAWFLFYSTWKGGLWSVPCSVWVSCCASLPSRHCNLWDEFSDASQMHSLSLWRCSEIKYINKYKHKRSKVMTCIPLHNSFLFSCTLIAFLQISEKYWNDRISKSVAHTSMWWTCDEYRVPCFYLPEALGPQRRWVRPCCGAA